MKPTVLNITDLAHAQTELTKIGVHPTGTQIMALKAIHRNVKFQAVDPKTANIIKQEMLSRGGDVALAGTVGKFEETKTDIIIMGNLAQYIRLIKKLKFQTYPDCQQIAVNLQELLFKNYDIEAAPVW
jgi:dihydropteroate synthase